MKHLFVYTIFACVLMQSVVVNAEPVISQSTQYYSIVGSSVDQLRAEMSSKGPLDPNSGRQVWAKTKWYVNWRLDYTPIGEKGCAVSAAHVTLKIEFLYPQWMNRDNAGPQLRAQWDRFFQSLVAHENMHARHGIAAAQQLQSELPKLYSRTDCQRLKDEAGQRGRDIVRNYSNADIRLDQRTDNGRKDGVTLP